MAVVLVLDAEQRSALATVRSLGRAKHTVVVASHLATPLAAASRFSRASAIVPDPLRDPDGFAEAVCALTRRWNVDVVLPVTDASVLAMLPARGRTAAIIPLPSQQSFERISDKALLVDQARQLGIAVPAQVRLESRESNRQFDAATLHYPVVLKPARSVGTGKGARRKWTVVHIKDASALEEALSQYSADAFPLMIQERISGPGIGIFLLIHDGVVLAEFAHRRIREKPPSGGVSVYSESIAMPPALREASIELLRRFDWSGVAMVEYKLDARTGTAYIMEVNGRFWGSLQLAIDAGVDFPALITDLAVRRVPTSIKEYREGIRNRWFWGDVDHLLLRLRRTSEELDLDEFAPGRARAVLDFCTGFMRGQNEILRLGDPAPVIRETINWLRRR